MNEDFFDDDSDIFNILQPVGEATKQYVSVFDEILGVDKT